MPRIAPVLATLTATVTLDLRPGTYQLFGSLHLAEGMTGTLTVTS